MSPMSNLTVFTLRNRLPTVSLIELIWIVSLAVALYAAARLNYFIWRTTWSPLRHLPGPRDRGNLLFGHLNEMMFAADYKVQLSWREYYGGTFAVRTFWGQRGIVTTDPRALTHILFATHVYAKTDEAQRRQVKFLGRGVLSVAGKEHRDQRRVMNPAFGSSHVRKMAVVFIEKAAEMCEIWTSICAQHNGTARVNAIEWLSRATLDIIGKTGFGHEFNSLHTGGDELSRCFDSLFRKDTTPMEQARNFLSHRFSLIARLAPGRIYTKVTEGKRKLDEISRRIVRDKKAAVLAEAGMNGKLDKASIGGTDLLSLLIKANLAEDLDPSLRLTEEAVMAQIPTFIAAGHETTSNATAWALLELATRVEIQTKLREELFSIAYESPSIDAINNLPYLDGVVRETLRLHAVVSFLVRQTLADDIIPLSNPLALANGSTTESICIQKGDNVIIPIHLLNTDVTIWGPTALSFDPSRWSSSSLPSYAQAIPGITPNLLTFMGGPRACIGHRFAVMEMKALLFHIVRRFEFQLGVEKESMWTRSGPVVRPMVKGTDQVALPLIIQPVSA